MAVGALMADLTGDDVLFVGLGKAVPQWYRCALPAYHLGARWIGYSDRPPRGEVATGNTMFTALEPSVAKVFIIQQARGKEWAAWIRNARKAGAKVLYEVDDFMPDVKKLVDSRSNSIPMSFKIMQEFNMCIASCDGAIVSTEYIGENWISEVADIPWWVCRNGIDTSRFSRSRAEREQPRIGWFGGGAHDEAIKLWAPAVTEFCNTMGLEFLSIGQQYDDWSGIKKLIRIPFGALECVPDVLAGVDIGLAPWADTPFYNGKSDLRVLEGAAAGIAMLADPRGYGETEAWWAYPDDVYTMLSTMTAPRGENVGPAWPGFGKRMRQWVEKTRDASVTAADWEVPLNQLAEEL